MDVAQSVQHAELHARVIKADGTVVEYGCVSVYDRNPLKQLRYRLLAAVRRLARR